MIRGADWAEKLEIEKNNTSITDITHIEEVNGDRKHQSTSDIAHIKNSQVQILIERK